MDAQEFVRYGQYAHLDPMPRAYAAMATGAVTTSNRVVPEGKHRSVFVNEYLRPLERYQKHLDARCWQADGRFAALSILQGTKQNSYDDDDIARLERLAPHLTRALQIRRFFLQSEARGNALESIVDRNETGMVGLHGGGPALFVNGAARAVAAAHDGIGLDRRGRLLVDDRVAATRLATLHADVCAAVQAAWFEFQRPSGRLPYILLVSQLPSGEDLFPNSRGGVLFAIHDPARRKTRPNGASLRCCTFRLGLQSWCRRCSKAWTSKNMQTAPASR